MLSLLNLRDSIGASAIAGDLRWAGSFGVNVDFVARSHCSVEIILLEDMAVCDTELIELKCPQLCLLSIWIVVLTHELLQAILEKFEFFPIKCRVQRALESFKDTCKRKETKIDKAPSMKQKVLCCNTIPLSQSQYGDMEFDGVLYC
jgi:hypothetical protein